MPGAGGLSKKMKKKYVEKQVKKNIEEKSASVWGEWMRAWGGWTVHPAADLS